MSDVKHYSLLICLLNVHSKRQASEIVSVLLLETVKKVPKFYFGSYAFVKLSIFQIYSRATPWIMNSIQTSKILAPSQALFISIIASLVYFIHPP
jgi:hypothetical protein